MATQNQMLYNQERDFMDPTYSRYSQGYGTNQLSPDTISALNQFSSRNRFDAVSNPNAYGTDFDTQAAELGLAATAKEPGMLDSIKSGLQNEGLMKGILGAGQLGLGIASYLDSSRLMNEQLKSLKQNRQQAAKNFQDQQSQRAAINAGFSSALG